MGPLMKPQRGWDVVKKVQEVKDFREPEAGGFDKRIVRARQRAIGRELRRFYDGVAEEPVPDEFLDLLRQIDGTLGVDGEDEEAS
jgi:hypothetical protein